MKKSKKTASVLTATLESDVQKVWDIVTNLEEYSWRTDIKKIEIIKENQIFTEESNDGFVTSFTITKFEPTKQYEFDIENENMSGHWAGIFKEDAESGGSIIEFTEEVEVKKIIMKPFIKAFLKKQQAKYIEDLKIALGE